MQPSQPPPPYDALFSASNPFPTDARLPPEYSDVSSVPAAAALSWAQITAKPPPPSSVQAQREQNGNVASYDERLNAPDELWRFLVQHAAEAPILELEIEGWDTETMYQPRDYNDNEVRVADATGIGQTHTPRFWIAVDLSSYLAQAPSRILDVKGRPIAAAIDDYALSTNQLKELVLTKQIVWDFEELKRAVYGIVRQAVSKPRCHSNFDTERWLPGLGRFGRYPSQNEPEQSLRSLGFYRLASQKRSHCSGARTRLHIAFHETMN